MKLENVLWNLPPDENRDTLISAEQTFLKWK